MIEKFLNKLKDLGWKQKEIAAKCGLTPAFICDMSHGKGCSLETAIKIADAFEVSIDEVLDRKPSRTLTPTEELLLQITANDDDIARAALRCAQGEKLIKTTAEGKGRGKAKAA